MSIFKIAILCTALLLPNIVFAECIVTGINFSKTSNIIYVNPNNGSDQLAKVYSLDNVRNPYEANNVAAFQSIEKAKSLADSDNGDLILIRAGRQWTSFNAWEGNSLSDFNKDVMKAKGKSQRECTGEAYTWVPSAVNDNQPASSPVKSDFISNTEDVTLTRAEESAPIRLPGITSTSTADISSTNTSSSSIGGSRSSGGSTAGGRSSSGSNTTQQSSSQSLLSDSTANTTTRNKASNTLLASTDKLTDISDSEQSVSSDSSSETIIEDINDDKESLGLLSCEVNAPWQSAIQKYPQDSNGWSIITPDKETRIVYVSSTQGNDSLARPYLSSELKEPFNPSGIRAYRTIQAAIKNLREGKPDWILLRKGDTFSITKYLSLPSGASKSAHTVLGAYGVAEKRPVIDTNDSSGVMLLEKNFITINGIEFYPSKLDPNNPNFLGWGNMTKPVSGIANNGFGNGGHHLFIENTKLSFYSMNIVITADGEKKNIVIRRNEILNAYSERSHSQGLYAHNVNGFLIEDNLFDHNGWFNPRGSNQALNDKAYGAATYFNHNAYLSAEKNLVIRNNIFSRASSMGLKLTSNADTESKKNYIYAYNHLIKNNFFVEGEIGISAGGNNDFNNGYRWQNMYITNNTFTNIGRTQPTGRELAWYLTIDDWDTGMVCNNNLTDNTSSAVTNVMGIAVNGDNKDVRIFGNNIIDIGNDRATNTESSNVIMINNLHENTSTKNRLDIFLSNRGFSSYDDYINYNINQLDKSERSYYDVNNLDGPLMFINNSFSTK